MARSPAQWVCAGKSEGRQLPAGGQLIRLMELQRGNNPKSIPVLDLSCYSQGLRDCQ